MNYELKAYMFRPDANTLDLKVLCKLPSFEDMIEFVSRVSFMDYDRILILPEDLEKEI